MSKQAKIWLVAATALVLLGAIMFAAVMTAYHWDFTKLSTAKYETNTYEIGEPFSSIAMNTTTADILFAPSDDGKCKVVCYEPEKEKHIAVIQDGTLTVSVVNERAWYEYIGITMGTPKITVYLPDTEYGALSIKESTGDIEIPKDFSFTGIDISVSTGAVKSSASTSQWLKIKASTGAICVENVSAGEMELSVSTGAVKVCNATCTGDIVIHTSTGRTDISDIRCKNLISGGSTGNITLKNVIAAEGFSIDRSTGDVKFDGCDAAEIRVETDTGDVTGRLLTDKVFLTHTDTGDIDVPQSITGGKCEVSTDTGDICIQIQP